MDQSHAAIWAKSNRWPSVFVLQDSSRWHDFKFTIFAGPPQHRRSPSAASSSSPALPNAVGMAPCSVTTGAVTGVQAPGRCTIPASRAKRSLVRLLRVHATKKCRELRSWLLRKTLQPLGSNRRFSRYQKPLTKCRAGGGCWPVETLTLAWRTIGNGPCGRGYGISDFAPYDSQPGPPALIIWEGSANRQGLH